MINSRWILLAAALLPAGLTAQTVLFADTFDRPDNRNIDATLEGITDNTGSALAPDGVYLHGRVDPNNASPNYGVEDADPLNGGGVQILGNQLRLAVGSGTASTYINHNFTNPEILEGGGFSVTVDVSDASDASFEEGGAVAVGLSAAEASVNADAFADSPRLTNAFSNGTTTATVHGDFWFGWRGNGRLTWGVGPQNLGVRVLPEATRTITAVFKLTSFDDGALATYELLVDGAVPLDQAVTGTFAWRGTDENFIALDARDNQLVAFDNLEIAALDEAGPTAALAVAPGSISGGSSSETITLTWQTAGIPAGSTYQITTDKAVTFPNFDNTGSLASPTDSGEVDVEVNGQIGDVVFTLEVLDAGESVIASTSGTLTTAAPTFNPTQTAVRLDQSATAEPVTFFLDNLTNFPAGATYEITDDNPAAATYLGDTTGAVFDPLFLDVEIDATQGPVTFTVLLKDSLGAVFDTVVFSVVPAAPAPPTVTNLFSDNFDRYTGDPLLDEDIDSSNTGMSGKLAPADPPADFYREIFEGSGLGSSLQINSFDALTAANGAGMSAWTINHNFLDEEIAQDGGLSIAFDAIVINSGDGDAPDRYIGFGIGLPEEETGSFTDESNVAGNGPRGSIFDNVSRGLADFYVSVSQSDMVQVFANGVVVGEFPVDGNGVFGSGGTAIPPVGIRADFAFEDPVAFSAGSFVFYKVYANGLTATSGYFKLTQTGGNFIGFSARATVNTELDDLVIATVAAADMPYPGDPADPPPSAAIVAPAVEEGVVTSVDLTVQGRPGVSYELEKSTDLSFFDGYGVPGAGVEGFPSATRSGVANESGEVLIQGIASPAGFETRAFYRGAAFHWPAP